MNRGQFTYEITIFDAVRAQLTVKTLSSNENTLSLGLNDYPVENEDFPIIWYLQVIDRCGWDSGTAITRLDISDLNEILLKNRVSNITTLLY